MEYLQNYSSSDSEEEQSNTNESDSKLIPPPPIEIFSQHQQMRTLSTTSLFSYIPWKPSLTTTSNLDKLTNYITKEITLLNQNYIFKPVNKDFKRQIKYHITAYPTVNIEDKNASKFKNDIRSKIASLRLPENSIVTPPSSSIQMLNMLSKKSIRLKFENKLILGKSPTKSIIFLCGVVNLDMEIKKYIEEMLKVFNETTKENRGQVQFPDLLKDSIHISLATGYPKSANVPNFEELDEAVKSINVDHYLNDINIDINELIIRDMRTSFEFNINLI
ncbi:hypothetical protein KGF54_002194 [Candida jiufengensis]|uniref:uncharacterized protein n=1 Tax=Candida jiufengensis TaxID=497108 RepID=UPI002223FB72|nr:uncharacterized protein KGF54_002194 [Candida jiufengensis]KAI5954419.1 hypothetical protein KGF54_002194 [Candida jiufengensis]